MTNPLQFNADLMAHLDAALTLPSELAAAYERIAELECVLEECEGHFDNRSDVIDGDYGQPEANAEMTMLGIVRKVLNSQVIR